MDSLVPTHAAAAAGGPASQTKAMSQPAERRYRPATEVVFVDTAPGSADAGAGAGNPVNDAYGASSVPIYQTATFKQISANGGGDYDYSRSESHVAKLMSANRAFAVASGMSALDVITRMVKAGEEIVAGDDIYGGTHRLLTYLSAHSGVRVHHVDTSDPEAVLAVLNQRTRLVLLETPTNPLLTVCDVPRVAADVHRLCKRALVVVDNTMMSPYLQKPLELGADIVYHSGTKYLSGHHDLMAGVIGVRSAELAEVRDPCRYAGGRKQGPDDGCDAFMERETGPEPVSHPGSPGPAAAAQANAMRIAQYLEMRGFRVFYPGLPSHPQRELHYRMSRGPGAVLSFVTGDVSFSERIVEAPRLWGISVSFGCVNSLIR
ncbi:MAG: cystathionine beta-lyase [Olpidium bornovanus]|uniref:cysteine-S-conjugate beta-lyase n=1 Tax=Olpidium bornovanus TaxID=278681 RepID=A0A8H7ZSM3_9FUNG|nr:MAG: cystathionine beta-lyase [Olpidium bornovanus]